MRHKGITPEWGFAPRFVLYSDMWPGSPAPPDASRIKGYNVFALSFWTVTKGLTDRIADFVNLEASLQKHFKDSYHEAGISLIVAAFGSTDAPTTMGYDPTTVAQSLAAFVLEHGLDGVDIDYEDFAAMDARNGSAETWLITFTKALRAKLPQGQFILTHAPVAPWFDKSHFTSGAYKEVNDEVGWLIDWYNVQFYNQGDEYTTMSGLVTKSSSRWPNTAVLQLPDVGVPLDKVVIGKPATKQDAGSGYMEPGLLAQCLDEAHKHKWSGGVAVWQFPHATKDWIKEVRSLAFPVSE